MSIESGARSSTPSRKANEGGNAYSFDTSEWEDATFLGNMMLHSNYGNDGTPPAPGGNRVEFSTLMDDDKLHMFKLDD